jgi:glycosyltransferase involved in cell wall biosynthesis
MKIVQLIHTQQLRGAETFAAQLSNHLTDRNHEVFIVALYSGKGQLPTELSIENLAAKNAFDIKAMQRFSSFIKKNNIDIVQANAGDTLKFAVMTKMMFRYDAKVIFRNASTISRYLRSFQQKIFYKFLLKKTDHIISVSETSKADILKFFPNLQKKTSVVPVGVEDHDSLLNQKERVLLHVGGFSFEKNHSGLLSIFSRLLSAHADLQLWLVGDGILRKETMALAEELNIADRVVFWGARNDVAHFMHKASVFVLPSILEGLPAVIMEAMHAQLPVVAYNAGGIHELVKNNKTGWLIPVNDEVAFAGAITEALTDDRKTAEIVKQATLLVNKEYKNEVIAARFENIYSRLLKSELYNTEKLQAVL